MSRDEVLALLRTHKPVLERRFGVVDLALFGSFARDSATAGSDIDILIRFDGPADWRRYFGAQFYIEDLFGRSVDLVTDKALRTELRPAWSGRPFMSEPGDAQREWRLYIGDMIGFCERVRDDTAGLDKATFLARGPTIVFW